MSWLDALAEHARAGTASVLVTVLDARGSTPRESGAKMVVGASALHGTIGGGRLEHECVQAARALLTGDDPAPLLREFPLGPALGQCCGGAVRVLLEPVRPPAWQVALFGAGHVGRAVARLLADLPCRLHWIDARDDAFPEPLGAQVLQIRAEHPEARVASLPPGAMALVMTHDHALDYRIIRACLARADVPFVGLIGSQTKAARFRARLRRDGQPAERLACPIGLPGIGGKLPAEIAIATVAQVLQLRDAAALRPALPVADNVRPLKPLRDGCGEGGAACETCVERRA